MSYNFREKINHIGYCTNQIVATNNLPSIKQLLAVLFYNRRRVSKTLHDAAKLTIEECLIIWTKARIPTQKDDKCIAKLEADYERWRKIQRNSGRTSDTQKKKEKEYEESLNKLFEIANANALTMMNDENDKKFLREQRAMSRSDNSGSEISNAETVEPSPMEIEDEVSTTENDEILTNLDNDNVVNDSIEVKEKDRPAIASKALLDDILGPESESPASQNTPPLKRRATETVMTEKLAIALDKCKVSKRDTMHLMIAAAEAYGIDPRNLVMNTTSIYEARQSFRKKRYEALKELAPKLFSGLPSTIHWDGKMLAEQMRRETTDRLAIIVTCGQMEQLLGVSKLTSGSGANQAKAVFDSLTDWCLTSNIEALCCDSTASNTGRKNGACILLERLVDKELLYLICRHHIYEIILKCAFETKFGKSSGPDVPIFKEFENLWESMNKANYESGISDDFVKESLQDVREGILNFRLENLKKDLTRSDYREFLELVIIFLGGQSPADVTFHPPGTIHHARWMAKAVYCLKMFIFRKQFLSNNKDTEIKCRDVCIFIVKVYTQAWFCASIAAQAPNQDLQFLKCLYQYKCIDQSISDCTVKKFKNHLWYLTPEMTALSFFDDNVSREEKLKMCEALQSSSGAFFYEKRILANEKNLIDLVNLNIWDFICKDTNQFFERFKINKSFLIKDPSKWKKDRDFIHGLEIVKNLRVVNDTAERGVKLMSEFNNLLTKDPKQSQYLLPVIEDYRSVFSDSNKDTLMKSYQ